MNIPRQVETRDMGLVYDSVTNEWSEGYQSVFRPISSGAVVEVEGTGSAVIIPGEAGKSIRIVSIALIVSGALDIVLFDGGFPISGVMVFGSADQPRGIVIPFPYAPLGLGSGNSFSIATSGDGSVAGTVCYFIH